ncbi:waprin-Phi2-like [Dendropsophus ebraccatus]|uniref:waprin-Phi2-like n=1 Tax=Dendropsophus ebraccatus TaxID=150705 RepID=UPI0038319B65
MKLYLLLAFLVELTCVGGASVTSPSPTVVPTNKTGTCPTLGSFPLGICSRRCNDDSDCSGVRKCCKTSCNGYQCQIPDYKPGSCPPVEIINGTTCDPSLQCLSDSKCEEDLKCCPNSCNHLSCQNKV